jgi:hypothetical protein
MVLAGAAVGCARPTAPIIVPEAPLGRVIIYRNGVAYFERHAVVDGELSLKVPRARVDDFLKSLTVVDVDSGKPLAISYATPRETSGAFVDMTIAIPPGRREVNITYVTESPAWKPSYRVVLGKSGQARLQSWAVVDNVSGEAWDNVQVGVGSTSALSFRYDLHSVRVVERETIDQGNAVAAAPPTGGSAYAVAGGRRRVLANVSVEDLTVDTGRDFTAVVESSATTAGAALGTSAQHAVGSLGGGAGRGGGATRTSRRRRPSRDPEPTNVATKSMPPAPPSALDRLANELANSDTRVRIEGNALLSEREEERQGLRRANTLREALVARGISTDRIDVVDGGQRTSDPNEVVRVVAIEDEATPTQALADGEDNAAPRGTAHFLADGPITLDAGHSAMVTLLDAPTDATRVYLYDPNSDRGSRQFAFNAVRIDNPSDHTLDTGPVTVYADQQFLGEGLAEPIPPRATAIVPYALDRNLRVRPRSESKERIQRLVKVERGIATTQTQRTRSTVLEIDNRGTAAAKIYVRHRVASGWEIANLPEDVERLGDDYLVPISVAAGASETLTVEETMPITTSIDLRSQAGFRAVEVYLESGDVQAQLAGKLRKILDAHRRLRDLDDELATNAEQMGVLRGRVTELNVQLVSLRKVGKAQSLSSHLAKRMKTLGDDLDRATLAATELQTERLTSRIELSNLVADLTLAEPSGGAGVTANASPSP